MIKYMVKNITFLFALTTLFWFLRMVLPGMKYVFSGFFLLQTYLIIQFYYKTFWFRNFIIEFIKTLTPLFLLGLFYLWGIILSGGYSRVITDFFEFGILLALLFYYYIIIHSTKDSETFGKIYHLIINLIGISSVLVAILGLGKFLLQNSPFHTFGFETPLGTSINSDKNFYSLYSFLGIFSFVSHLFNEQTFRKRFFYQILIGILVLNIIFSFSVRAYFILPVLVLFVLLIQVLNILTNRYDWVPRFSKNTRLLVFFLVITLLVGFFSQVETRFFPELSQKIDAQFNKSISETAIQAFHFDKWQFTMAYFSQQPLLKQLFGSGFDYLNVFGEHYYHSSSRIDYPHNPILSALLYSGIVGAIFALLFLIISVYYSILYLKKYPLFSLMLWVSLLFVFFSGNSLFSVPVFLFLFSLAFLIRHQEITDLHIDFNLNKPGSKLLKEVVDYLAATIVLIILSPILVFIGLLILLTMGWPVFFSQMRVGQNGKIFRLHKFRTMTLEKSTTTVAALESERVPLLGKFLRKSKLDELPELWNIIRGDMSFVGPRPDVPGYADSLKGTDRTILTLKPGLTGPASLKYINEDEILSRQPDPQKYNDEVIFPDKVRINLTYMKHWTLWLDMKIIIFTALRKPLNNEYFK